MTRRKVAAVFLSIAAAFVFLEARLLLIMSDDELAQTAAAQNARTYELAELRPDFYDVNGEPLTGAQSVKLAVAWPRTAEGYTLLRYLPESRRQSFLENMQGEQPFAVSIPSGAEYSGLTVCGYESRYAGEQLARHIIGTLDSSGGGESGLELALDSYLAENSAKVCVTLDVNANGELKTGADAELTVRGTKGAGVSLTLDARVQRTVERQASRLLERGAVVVLDAESAEIRAIASLPSFDALDVASALEDEAQPLYNRALAAYSVGSIYKPVVAAAALDAGLDASVSYDCSGSITLDGRTYACNDSAAHGLVDMRGAIVKSCNAYFINLGGMLGGSILYNAGASLGLTRPAALCGTLSSSKGSFPTLKQLLEPGELSNHCFGQGALLLTPLHVAAYTRCIASRGLYRAPTLVKSVGGRTQPESEDSRVFSQRTAETVASFMLEAVERGTGVNAKPEKRDAAGKTGTAQTGRYDESGREYTIGWFTGWFPAAEPKYVITVMTEDEGYGFENAAPVFKAIADELAAQGLA